MISGGVGGAPAGPCGVSTPPACHGEAYRRRWRGRACAGGWCACGRMISGGVGGTPAGPAVRLPALLAMVRAFRRRCGAPPAAYDLAAAWCTCGACGGLLAPPVMVRACRRWWRGVLAPVGGVPAGV
ncbi:MAG: hypothetical protein MSQ05_01290 [Akkermansia sp.]|nr:hypothetical protein [Akkermansia sp.]